MGIRESWEEKTNSNGEIKIVAHPIAKKKKTPDGWLFLVKKFQPAWVKADIIISIIAVIDIFFFLNLSNL